MGLVKEIENSSIIAVDTTVFIYYIEKNPKYFDLLETIFKRCNSKEKPFKLITSMITLIEVLTKPLKDGKEDITEKYKEILLNSDNVFPLLIDKNIAEKAAELRAKYSFLRTPDAIQVAAAIVSEADYFISNDKKLKDVSGIKSIVLDDLVIKVN